MVDQTTRGHQFILKHFGKEAAPRATWQIDPFGHSQTQAWLLGAEAGFEGFFWGRMDWQDRTMRYKKQQGHDGFEWIWRGRHPSEGWGRPHAASSTDARPGTGHVATSTTTSRVLGGPRPDAGVRRFRGRGVGRVVITNPWFR